MKKVTEKDKGGVPIGTILIGSGVVLGIGGAVYIAYKYFVEPGNYILATYRYMIEDIMTEQKKFAKDNSQLDPPVTGLLSWQEALIEEKRKNLAIITPEVEKVLESRNIDVNSWIYAVIEGAVIAVIAVSAIAAIRQIIINWRQKPQSASIVSGNGVTHLVSEIVINELAITGNLAAASGLNQSMLDFYNTYTASALQADISLYQQMLAQLTPGTLDYLVMSNMLSYVTTEISTTIGILSMMQFWLPPLI